MNRTMVSKFLNRSFALGLMLLLAGCGAGAESDSGVDVVGADAGSAHPGQEVYEQFCYSCHTPGLSGAPQLGDVEAWGPRIAKGRDLLIAATINGIAPAMPQRGLCLSCSDEELAAAVDYMIEQSQ